MKSDNTVERTIYFGVIDWKYKNKAVDVFDIFNSINKIPFDNGERYHQTSDGQRYEIIIDKMVSPDVIYGCIGDSRITDLPSLEKHGSVSPLRIAKDEGIFDAMHFMVKKNANKKWIITYEFNFYAPRASAINLYVRNKLPSKVDYVAISPIEGESINQVLKRIKQIRSIRMGIHKGADVSALSGGLSKALKELQHEQDGNYIDISFSARRSRGKTLSGNLVDNIPYFFKTMGPQMSLEHFKISGIRSDTGEPEEINLMDIILKEKKQVEKMRRDYRFIDPKRMFVALGEAYNARQSVIDRV